MNVKQISIFIENKPGTLYDIVETLEANDIHIKSFTAAENGELTELRLLVDNILWTASILKNSGCKAAFIEVLLIDLAKAAGGLSRVLDVLKYASVNIVHVYPLMSAMNIKSSYWKGGTVYMIFEVDDVQKAAEALESSGITITTQEELAAL